MLRSLLHQLLSKHRVLIPLVKGDRLLGRLPATSLREALEKVLTQSEIPLKVCLFLDGLDEFSGDHKALAATLQDVSKHKKSNYAFQVDHW